MFNVFIKIVDWLCLSLRDTCGLGDLQTPSDPSHPACPHPSDPGGSDRSQHKYLSPVSTKLSFPHVGSVYCVLVVAIERYFSVCRPFEQKVFSSCVILTLETKMFRQMDGCTSSVWWLSPLHIISLNFWNLRQFTEELIPTILAGKKPLVK